MSNLLGGNSKQSSSTQSSNQAYGTISNDLGSTASGVGDISSLLSSLLTGTGGTDAYNAYKNSTGFNQQMQAGSQAITDNAASRGLLQSGSTAKALTQYGTNLANQNYGNYLTQLLGAQNSGINAAQVIAGAGQQSSGSTSGKSKTGLGL